MLGAIIGDIAGSRFEGNNHKGKDFELMTHIHGGRVTDDSIMSLAIAKAILVAWSPIRSRYFATISKISLLL